MRLAGCTPARAKLRGTALLAMGLLCPACLGCGPRGDLPLDQDLAQRSLSAALDAWKAAQKPADLAARQPKIIVSEPHWEGGYKLEGYEIKQPAANDGMNLHFDVKLTTRNPQGKWEQHDVTYVVGTSPAITIALKPE